MLQEMSCYYSHHNVYRNKNGGDKVTPRIHSIKLFFTLACMQSTYRLYLKVLILHYIHCVEYCGHYRMFLTIITMYHKKIEF